MKAQYSYAIVFALLAGQASLSHAARTIDVSFIVDQTQGYVPGGLAVNPSDGHIFVTSNNSMGSNLWELSASGALVRSTHVPVIELLPYGGDRWLGDIAFGGAGTLYAGVHSYAGHGLYESAVFEMTTAGIRTPANMKHGDIAGITYDPGRNTLLIADYGTTVTAFSTAWAQQGTAQLRSNSRGIAFDPLTGSLFSLLTNQRNVDEYKRNGDGSLTFQRSHDLKEAFNGISFDQVTGELYAVNHSKIVAFTRSELTVTPAVPLPGALVLFSAGMVVLPLVRSMKGRTGPIPR